MTVPESKRKANKKWNQKNKDRVQYINKRSASKSFIKNLATQEDIGELRQLIDKREVEIKNDEI